MSQLLQSLMAHDLRAPLALAAQALQVARETLPGSSETQLLHDVEGRLERSLDTVDRVLEASRAALAGAPPTPLAGGTAEASRAAGALAGNESVGSPSLVTFFGEAKKVTACRAGAQSPTPARIPS